MDTMSYPTNYQMVDRITPVRKPAPRKGPGKRAVTAMCLLCIGAAGTGGVIGTLIATLIGLR